MGHLLAQPRMWKFSLLNGTWPGRHRYGVHNIAQQMPSRKDTNPAPPLWHTNNVSCSIFFQNRLHERAWILQLLLNVLSVTRLSFFSLSPFFCLSISLSLTLLCFSLYPPHLAQNRITLSSPHFFLYLSLFVFFTISPFLLSPLSDHSGGQGRWPSTLSLVLFKVSAS